MEKSISILKTSEETKIDLLIERDAGNSVRILMGKGTDNWEKLREVCNEAIEEIKSK